MFMISSTDEGSSSYLDAVRLFADSLFGMHRLDGVWSLFSCSACSLAARNDYRRALHHYRLFIQKRTQQNKRGTAAYQTSSSVLSCSSFAHHAFLYSSFYTTTSRQGTRRVCRQVPHRSVSVSFARAQGRFAGGKKIRDETRWKDE